MEIFTKFNDNFKNLSLALGFFDGVHLGHQVVISKAVEIAKQSNSYSGIITFKNNPKELFCNKKLEYIFTNEERLHFFEELGVDIVFMIDFTENLSKISANDYLQNIISSFSPISITTGFNHYFGENKEGSPLFLEEMQNKYNFKYNKVNSISCEDEIISSSLIKDLIKQDRIIEANKLLGHSFKISSIVQKGREQGRLLGFRTANIFYPENKIKISTGVWICKVEVKNKLYNGILNFGYNPTLTNLKQASLETHILDFDEDIYDENIKILPIKKLRNEKKFNSKEELILQIKSDKEATKNFFNKQ